MNSLPRPQLVFRADGGAQIGLGHVMRCLAIAEMIGHSFKMSFAIQAPSEPIQQLIQQASLDLINLPETSDYESDAHHFAEYLTGHEFVVLDGYSFRDKYQQTLKLHCQKLIAVDDLVSWHQYADVVINHAGNAQVSAYQAEPYTHFLLGTPYALLRQPFLEAGKQRPIHKLTTFQPQCILVNLGGADPENISQRVIDYLLQNTLVSQITVVLGAANLHKHRFTDYDPQRVEVRQNLAPDQVIEAIDDCDVAIVSCSTISYEVATVGKPFVGIITADNQSALRDFYTENQLALAVLDKGFTADELTTALSSSVPSLNASLVNQKRFFDGRSGERIDAFFRTLLPNQ